tara:strand:+ start:4137 stop:4817 length:681 start_codon:yes stop_codon:yes gene_type:complete
MTLCALPVLTLLVGLGFWQLDRLEWKEALIYERAYRGAMPIIPIADLPNDEWQEFEYRRLALQGRYLHDREMLIWNKVRHGQNGFDLITPFLLESGSSVLINRGWVPPSWSEGVIFRSRPVGSIKLTGVMRRSGRPTKWVPDNNAKGDEWFFVDVTEMAKSAGLTDTKPYLVIVKPNIEDRSYPKAPHARDKIRNKHLEYAVTWFGLAGTLVVIYVAYHWRRRIIS